MGSLIKFTGTESEIKERLNEIRAKCRFHMKKGYSYPYNMKERMIESKESGMDYTEVLSIVEITKTSLIAILPYNIAKSFTGGGFTEEPKIKVEFAGALREYQQKDSEKVINALASTGRCYFKACPSYGKTVMISYVISHFKEKALVVVPTIPLGEQTETSLKMMLPSVKIHIMDTDRVIPPDTDIVICFIRRLNGISTPIASFRTIIFDEVHLLSAPLGIAAMLTSRPNRLLALTATGGDREKITEMFVGGCEIESEMDKQWYITFPHIRSNLDGSLYSGVDGYTNAINDLINSECYIKTIVRMVKYFHYMEERSIVITMRVDMRDKLAELIGLNKSIKVEILKPENKGKKCGNCDVIIGTHKIMGTGFDMSNYIENFDGKNASIMIFIGSFKDPTMWYQISGRAFRAKNPLAVFPVIHDLPISIKHAGELHREARKTNSCTILSEYATFLEHFNDLSDEAS
jgi:hypothetical protein